MNNIYHFCDTLKALRITTYHSKDEEYRDGYYILNIDFLRKRVNVSTFPNDKEDEANNSYLRLEKASKENRNAVVLVSVPRMRELQEAYPSYFLDTKGFLNALDTMIDNCRKWGLVKS